MEIAKSLVSLPWVRSFVFTGWLLAGLAGGSRAGNLLPSGGFESGDLKGVECSNPFNHPLKLGVTSEKGTVHAGKYACAIEASSEPFVGDVVTTAQVFRIAAPVGDLPAGTLLRAQLWIRTENLSFRSPIGHRKYKFVDTVVKPMIVAIDAAGNPSLCYGDNGSFKGTTPYTRVEFLFQRPPKTVKAELQLMTFSPIKTGKIYVDDAMIEPATLGEIPRDIPRCEVKRDAQGTPRLWMGGKRRTPLFTFGNTYSPKYYEEVSMASKIGVDCVQFPINLPWVALSSGTFEQVLQANPNAMFFPRIHFNVPRDKLDEYRGDWALDQDRKPVADFPSLASDAFFDELKEQVVLAARYLYTSPFKDHIMGLQLGYPMMGELFYPELTTRYLDFSEVNRRKFAHWLSQRYGNEIGHLNAAWKSHFDSFAGVQIPPAAEWEKGDDGLFRDPQNRRAVADYLQYHNELVAERMLEFAEGVKRLTARRALTGFFYGYQNELILNGYHHGVASSGHLALRKLLASPDVDLVCSPMSYFERKAGDPSNMHGLPDTIALAGKIPLIEEDSNTWLNEMSPADDFNTRYATEFDTLNCLRRNFGNVMMHNQASWWCDLWSDGRYLAPEIWDNNRKLAECYRDSVEHQVPSRPQIALIYDEKSYFWLKADAYALTERNGSAQRSVFQSCGAQVGYYHMEDLDKIPVSAKLIIFVNAFHVDEKEARLIQSVKNHGRTLLWLYAPGYVSEAGLSREQMQTLTGFALGKLDGAIIPAIQVDKSPNAFNRYVGAQMFGAGEPLAPTFFGEPVDKETAVLGRYLANGKPALLMKQFPGWKSVFCGAPSLSVPVLRGLCREAGVPLLVDPDKADRADVVACNGRYLFAYARGQAGVRQFQTPGPAVTVTDVLDNRVLGRGVRTWTADFKQNEQKIFRLTLD